PACSRPPGSRGRRALETCPSGGGLPRRGSAASRATPPRSTAGFPVPDRRRPPSARVPGGPAAFFRPSHPPRQPPPSTTLRPPTADRLPLPGQRDEYGLIGLPRVLFRRQQAPAQAPDRAGILLHQAGERGFVALDDEAIQQLVIADAGRAATRGSDWCLHIRHRLGPPGSCLPL